MVEVGGWELGAQGGGAKDRIGSYKIVTDVTYSTGVRPMRP